MGAPELIIIALIVLLIFGSSKLGDLGGSVGRGLREFRQATKDDDEAQAPTPVISPPATVALLELSAPSVNGTAHYCAECGGRVSDSQKFCGSCGSPVAPPAIT